MRVQFDNVVLIAAGIGATPFAALIKVTLDGSRPAFSGSNHSNHELIGLKITRASVVQDIVARRRARTSNVFAASCTHHLSHEGAHARDSAALTSISRALALMQARLCLLLPNAGSPDLAPRRWRVCFCRIQRQACFGPH